MKKVLILFLLLSGVVQAQQSKNESRMRSLVENLRKEEYSVITSQFDTNLRKSMDTLKISRVWKGLVSMNGPFKACTGVETFTSGKNEINYAHIQFEKRNFDLKVSFNEDNSIKTFVIVPPLESRTVYKEPDYARPDEMNEKVLQVVTGNYKLNGILSLPKNRSKVPVVIMVHGMGPNDKDETFGAMKIFKDVAYGLTTKGIGVFRYDKRTRQYGAMVIKSKNFDVRTEVTDDVLSAIRAVKADPMVDSTKIFLCGHSYGAMMLPLLAEEAKVAGYIFLAPDNRPVEDIMIANATETYKSMTNPRQKAQIDTMKAEAQKIKILKDNPTAFPDSVMFLRFPVSYWKTLATFDPMVKSKSITQPLLVLYGERDYQVVKSVFNDWKSKVTEKNATYKSYPGLNHFFVDGKDKSTPEEYKKPGNFSLVAITDMAEWIKGLK